ncbi:MAG: hypothetical protein NC218_11715 [Acetobacter sp.]|nr:hypothetical protein [Acetobacter sp.]
MVQFSQGIDFPLPKTATLISTWAENKERFFNLFGGQLILQSENKISVELTDKIKNDLIDTFLSRANDIVPRDCLEDFTCWIEDNRAGFFNNRIVEPLPQTMMRENSKLLRAFKYFVDDPVYLRQLQDLASQFIQQSKIEGYLCLSIHPLDYLTASENNSNWRSCHALDGEYRAGNLSYMLDKTTIICYLRSGADVQLERLPDGMLWNDKKWRMYVSISENNEIAFFSRQYPFTCDMLVEHILKKSPINKLELGGLRHDGFRKIVNGDNETIELDHNFIYYRYSDCIIDTRDICMGHKNALNYNDLVMSPSYTPVFAAKRHMWYEMSVQSPEERFKTEIGAEVPCLLCGSPIEDSNEFLCDSCWEREIEGVVGYCEVCGCSLYEDDDFRETDNGFICCDCDYDEEDDL